MRNKPLKRVLDAFDLSVFLDRVFSIRFNSLISVPVVSIRARVHVREAKSLRKLTFIAAGLIMIGGVGINLANPATSLAANSNTVNFQARLMNSSGSIVPDGTYNIEFKLYTSSSSSGSSQGSCTGDADCLWYEDYTGANMVNVVDGYLSVSLGSIRSFPSTIDWNQPLYLGMNVGGTGTPTWDGEMTPRMQLTAVPYAFTANTLATETGSYQSTLNWATQSASNNLLLPNLAGTLCVNGESDGCGFGANYIQNGTGLQASSNFNISGTGQAATGFTAPLLQSSSGNLTIQGASGTVSLGTSTNLTASGALTIASGGSNTNLSINSDGTGSINIGANGSGSNSIQIGDSSGAYSQTIDIGNNATAGATTNLVLGSTIAGTLTLQDSGITETHSGNTITLKDNATVNNSTTAFQVENGSSASVLDVDTSNTRVGINNSAPANLLSLGTLTTAASTYQLALTTGSTSNSGIVVQNVASQSAGYAFMLQNSTGTNLASIDYQGNMTAHSLVTPSVDSTSSLSLGTSTASSIAIGDGSNTTTITTDGFQIDNSSSASILAVNTGTDTVQLGSSTALQTSGTAQFAANTNSATAFQVQNTGSASTIFDVDTQNDRVGINTNAPSATLSFGSTGATVNVNQSTTGTGGNLTIQGGQGKAGGNYYGGNLYLEAGAGTGTDPSGNVIVQSNGANTTSAFEVQNAAGTSNLLVADTVNNKIGVAEIANTTGNTLQVAGGITATTGGILISAGGETITAGGLNLNSTGITSTGSIAGATTYAGNGNLTLSGTNANELAVNGAPLASATSSLVQIGNVIATGSINGTYLGINAPGGNLADFLNLEENGAVELQLSSAGALTTGGAINGQTISTAANFTGTLSVDTLGTGGTTQLCSNGGEISTCTLGGGGSYIYNSATTLQTSANIDIQSVSASNPTVQLEDAASQTADLIDFKNSSGTIMSEVTASGSLQGANGTGTDQAGSALTISGGQSTGLGNGGNILLQIASPASSTGSSLNALSTVATFSGANGSLTLKDAADTTTDFQVQGTSAADVLDVDTQNSRVGIGTNAPLGQLNVQSTSYMSNQVVINDGLSSTPPSYTNSYLPALVIQSSETNSSKLLYAGYNSGSSTWAGYLDAGACGGFSNICLDMGNGSNNYTALESNGSTLDVGGTGDNTFAAVNLYTSGSSTPVATFGTNGAATFENSTNNLTGFEVENQGGNSLIGVDTSGDNVYLGSTSNTALSSQVHIADSNSASYTQAATIGSNANALDTLTLDGGTAAAAIQIGNSSTAHGIEIGTGAGVQTLQIGSTNTTSNTTIQGGGNSSAITIQTAASGSINIGTNSVLGKIINIGSVAGTLYASTVNIASSNGNATQAVYIGNTGSANNVVSIQGGSSSLAIGVQAYTGGTISIGTTNANTINIGNATSTAVFSVESGTGITKLFNGATQHTIQLATGAAAQTVTIGSTNTTSTLALQAGTGGLTIQTQGGTTGIDNNAVAQTLAIGNTTTGTSINIQSGSSGLTIQTQGGTTGIDNNAVAQIIAIGNSTGATSLALQAGTGGINLGTGGVANTLQIGNTTGAVTQTINIGNNSTSGSIQGITIGSSANASDSLILDGGTAANAIQIGNSATIHGIEIGTSSSTTQTVSIGSSYASSTVMLQGGGSNVLINNAGVADTSTSATALVVQNSSSAVLTVDTTTADAATAVTINSGTSGDSGLVLTQIAATGGCSGYCALLGVNSSGQIGTSNAAVSLTSPALAYWDGINDPTASDQSYPSNPIASYSGSAAFSSGNGVLLNPATANTYGSINWSFAQVPFEEIQFQFKAGGGSGADATWFYGYANGVPATEYGCLTVTSPCTGGSIAEGYIIYFSEYHHCIGIAYASYTDNNQCTTGGAGDPLAAVTMPTGAINDNNWHNVDIQFFDNKIYVRWDGNLILQYSDVYNRDLTDYQDFGFGARSGGSTDNHYIKGLLVTKLSSATQYNVDTSTPLASDLYWENTSFNTTGAGNLGIGTSAPQSNLEVDGTTSLMSPVYTGSTGSSLIDACISSTAASCGTTAGTDLYIAYASGSGISQAMVGDEIEFSDGTTDTITGYTNAHEATLSTSILQPISSNFQILTGGLQVSPDSNSATVTDVSIGANSVLNNTADQDNLTNSSTTTAIANAYPAYDLSDDSTSNATRTQIFNITGLPSTEGNTAYIVSTAQKSAVADQTTVEVEINGTQMSEIVTTGTAAQTLHYDFIVMYADGSWHIVGTGPLSLNTTAGTGTNEDGYDYAEWIPYSGDTQPQPGDVLTVGSSDVSVTDSDMPYDPSLMGVVSTNPYEVGGSDDGHSVVIALAGRVPVKVNLQNGPIQPGDPLTSSSTPGEAMKATGPGDIIGTALESYDGTESSNEIDVQLHVGYDDPGAQQGQLQGNQEVTGNLTVDGNTTLDGNSTVNGNETVQGSATIEDGINASGTSNISTLLVGNTLTDSGNLEVDGTALLDTLQSQTGSISGDFSVGGNTSLASLLVGNDLSVNGNITVSGTADVANINVSGNTTTQNLTVNGTTSLAGDIQLTGQVNTRQATIKTFTASVPITAGSAVIIDTSSGNAGDVTTTSTPDDTRIIGVAVTSTTQAGQPIQVAISGWVQVDVDTALVNGTVPTPLLPGQLIVTSSTPGTVTAAASPAAGSILGKSTDNQDSNNQVWILITLQ